MRGEFVEVGGARLYYYAAGTRGTGESLLLLHGFPTSSHLWNQVVPLIPPGHRVVVADLLGLGRSDPPGGRDLSIPAHAGRVLGLMDTLGIARAAVVGHDIGGSVALQLALHEPARVSRLCLVNSAAVDTRPGAVLGAGGLLPVLLRVLPSSVATSALRSRMRRGYVSPERGSHSIEQYLRPFTNDAGQQAMMSHLSAAKAPAGGESDAALSGIRIPVAILCGSDDPIQPAGVSERLGAAIPGATVEVVPEARHFLPEESPQVVARVITELLSR